MAYQLSLLSVDAERGVERRGVAAEALGYSTSANPPTAFADRLISEYGYHPANVRLVTSVTNGHGRGVGSATEVLVFDGNAVHIIIVHDARTRNAGAELLKRRLADTRAEYGVWLGDDESLFLRQLLARQDFQEIPDIPRCGESLADIGVYRRGELVPATDLRTLFKTMYYHLYTNSNLPRAERLAGEMIRLLFCKIYDELHNDPMQFVARVDEYPSSILDRLRGLFEQVKESYADVVAPSETIGLDAKSAAYVVGLLQKYSLLDTDKDAVGNAFETFLGPGLRGEKGQFFTPRSVVHMMVDFLDPQPGERIVDPACGSGGFLMVALEHIRQKRTLSPAGCVFGIDKEIDLAKVARTYVSIVSNGQGEIFNADSLDRTTWPERCRAEIWDGSFDVVLTNPPFGSRIPVKDKSLLSSFDLGHRWTWNKRQQQWEKTGEVLDKQDPQILFVELGVRLLAPGGRMGIVLPEGLFGNRNTGYVLDYVRSQGHIIGVVDCPRTLFQPSTDTKTNVLFFRKSSDVSSTTTPPSFFLAVVHSCGHDRRGRPLLLPDDTLNDEFPLVAAHYHHGGGRESHLGFWRSTDELQPYYLIPRYYDPEIARQTEELRASGQYTLKTVEQLVEERVLRIAKGHEPGSHTYGTGDIPFVRTSNIGNWEVLHDPPKCVSEEVYLKFKTRQNLQASDILLVNDGRYRIGDCCILTEHDTRIVVQSHFRIIKVLNESVINPYLLLYLLKTPFVRAQIRAKTFIQSTIATLGPRLKEIVLPIPADQDVVKEIEARIKRIVLGRAELLAQARAIDSLYNGDKE